MTCRTLWLASSMIFGGPFSQGAWGQEELSQGLFSSHEVLHLTLEADFHSLKGDRSQESGDRPARLIQEQAGGGTTVVSLKVGTRGSFRLRKDICPFPPLRLVFLESPSAGTVFDGQDRLKLVTHCHEWESFEQNVLEEYLAYRLFNQLTDVSFRVRLAEITYVDTSGVDEPLTRMAFLIEDEGSMAARAGGMVLDIPGAPATAFQPAHLGLMFLFQYMIGNIDWSTANTQNLVVLRVGLDHFAVPYDFDWSGLVDARYAGPSPLTQRLHDSVRERLYLGVCWDEIDFPPILAHFQEKKGAILSTIREVPGLGEHNVDSAIAFIEEFYEFIEDPVRAAGDLRRMCREG